MKILAIGDTQLESRPYRDRIDASGKSIRFQENLETILDLIKQGKDEDCSAMIHLGDVVEHRDPDSATLTAAATMFKCAIDCGMSVDVINGNHDSGLSEISSSSIEAMSIVADKMIVHHKIEARPIPGGFLVFLPYLHKETQQGIKQKLGEAIAGLAGNLFLFAHYGVSGAKVGPGNITFLGDALDADVLHASRFKAILCGHYHGGQRVKLSDGSFVFFPGSPFCVNMAERTDKKGSCILDTETGEVKQIASVSKRKWLQFNWEDKDARWTAMDIVKFVGIYQVGENPQERIGAIIKSGAMPEPFSKSFEVTSYRAPRVIEEGSIEAGAGFRDAAAAFIAKRWPDGPDNPPVLELVLSCLAESKVMAMDKKIIPISLKAIDFMSHADLSHSFLQNEPELFLGHIGIGKTNILEAVLLCATGETSKQVNNRNLVRQGAKKTTVDMIFSGESNFYRILRTITLTAGTPSHKVNVWCAPTIDGPWDTKHSLADGSIKETQAVIGGILGASFTSLKATNFSFQGEHSPLIRALPSERRGILSEILGMDPIAKAWKVLNEKRLEVMRQLNDTRSRLAGVTEVYDPNKKPVLEAELVTAEQSFDSSDASLVVAVAERDAALEAERVARAAVSEAEKAIGAIPDHSAEIKAQEGAIKTLADAFNDTRSRRVVTYRGAEADIAKYTKSLDGVDTKALTAEIELVAKDLDSKALAAKDFQDRLTAIHKTDLPPWLEKKTTLKARLADLETRAVDYAPDVIAALEVAADVDTEPITKAQGDLTALIASKQDLSKQKLGRRKEIIETLLPPLRESITRMATRLADLKDELVSHSGSDIGVCSKCKQPIDSSTAEATLAKINADIAALELGIQAPRIETETLEAEAKKCAADNEVVEAEAFEAQVALSRATENFSNAIAAKDKYEQVKRDLVEINAGIIKSSADLVEPEAEVARLQAEAAKLEADIWDRTAELGTTGTARLALETKMRDAEAAVAALVTSNARFAEVIEEGEKAKATFEAQKQALDTAMADIVSKSAADQAQKLELTTALTGLASALSEASTAAEARRASAEAVRHEKVVLEERISNLRLKIAETQDMAARIADLQKTLATKERDHFIKQMAVDVLDPKSGLPSYLIGVKMPELEDGINRYLEIFETEIPVTVSLVTETEDGKDTLEILIDNGKKPVLDARVYSGGQLERIEICLKLALADLAEKMRDTSLGLWCLDETGLFFDDAMKSRLIETIYERAASGKTPVVLAIYHDKKIISGFKKRYMMRYADDGKTVFDAV